MNTHVEKTQENKSQSVANGESRIQSGGESSLQFVDSRPEAIAQRKLQEIANNSPRIMQANNSSQAKQAAQLQAMADHYSAQYQQFIQKKENNTGLPDNLKAGIENLSGMSLDDVKVHRNSDKPVQLQAHAYAQGAEIHLGPGQEKHLPHEAWHVVQQKQGRVKPTMQMKGEVNVNDDVGLEKEADVMGAKAMQMQPCQSYFSADKTLNRCGAQARPLQLKLLEPRQVLDALTNIEFGGDLIGRKIKLSDERFKTPQGLTLLGYALAKMNLLNATWTETGTGKDNHYNALLLSYAVDVVSDYISRTDLVNLPRIKPVITQALIQYFANEISSSIERQKVSGIKKSDISAMIDIARSLNGKDPITLYMKDILPLEKAEGMIREMAIPSKISVTEYFELLLNQFLDQIISLSPEEVAKGQAVDDVTEQNTGNDFPLQEVVGEISTDFYKYISHESETYKPADNHLLRETAVKRVEALRKAIYTPVLKRDEVEAVEDPTNLVLGFIQEITGVTPIKARQIQLQLIQHLAGLALQVTVKSGMWFNAEGLKTGVEYKSILGAQHKKESMSDVVKPSVEGQIDTLGRSGEGPMAGLIAERGPKYMRWRLDKDSRAEGIDIPFNVYPIYGCLNYWDVSQWGAGGSNYYGDVHFLLKNSVKARCFYKFTDAGLKRKTLLGLFNDLILRQKATAAVILGDVINAAIATKPTTRIEVVIPGGINIKTEVATIVVSSSVSPKVTSVISGWAGDNSIAFVGETQEMDERNTTTMDPVTGLHDKSVSDIAKRQFLLDSQTDLANSIRLKLADVGWNTKGKAFLGTKTPTGISNLITIFNSVKPPAQKLAEGKVEAAKRLLSKKARERATTDFYTLFSHINIQSQSELDVIKDIADRFDLYAK